MASKTKARELLLYSEQIKESDVKNLFNQVLKSKLPFLGFIDFRDIFSPNFINIITKRKLNTVQFFAKERKSLAEMSLLVFPYKISELILLEREKGSLFPFPKFYMLAGNQDFLSFTLKERIVEIDLKISKVLGKLIGFGTAVDESGRKSLVISTNPEKLFVLELEKNPSVYIEILDPIPKRMSVTSRYPVFEETGITVGVDNFDIFQHTLIVGASGTGKSKGLFALIKSIQAMKRNDVRIVVIDPHGEFVRMFPNEYVVDLVHNYVEPLDVGGNKTPLMTQLISQLLSSAIGGENKYSERVLFYAVHLLSSLDQMNLRNVSLLLTDSSKRAEFVSQVSNDEIKRFFDEEFNDIYIHHFNDAILPVLNFVGEYELYLGGDKKKEDLLSLINKNPITVITFNPNFFGKRMINFLAGAVINQMYILAITEKLKMPTVLVMDEFQRIETRVVKDVLSETRKFNLYAYLSMQYLGQLTKEVHDSIVSNVRNIVAFKLNKQDAAMISSIMEIKIEESFKKARTQTELEESKKEMFVRLHQRECIVRLFDGKKYILPMKLRVVDVAKWGYNPMMEMSKLDAARDTAERKEANAEASQLGTSVTISYGQEAPARKEEPRHEEAPQPKQREKPEDLKEKLFGMNLGEDELARLPKEREEEKEDEQEEAESESVFKDEHEPAQEEEAPAEEEMPAETEEDQAEEQPQSEEQAPEEQEESPAEEGPYHDDQEEREEEELRETMAERLKKLKERAAKRRKAAEDEFPESEEEEEGAQSEPEEKQKAKKAAPKAKQVPAPPAKAKKQKVEEEPVEDYEELSELLASPAPAKKKAAPEKKKGKAPKFEEKAPAKAKGKKKK